MIEINKNDREIAEELDIDLIKGLKGGLLHFNVCGDSKYRNSIFNEYFKEYCDKNEIIRDIRSAPRDARYKIDWYFSTNGIKENSIDFNSIVYFSNAIEYLKLKNDFNPKTILIDEKKEYSVDRITIGYGEVPYVDEENEISTIENYYLKLDGELATLCFDRNARIVDYNEEIWKFEKDQVQSYSDFEELLFNIEYYIKHFNLIDECKRRIRY